MDQGLKSCSESSLNTPVEESKDINCVSSISKEHACEKDVPATNQVELFNSEQAFPCLKSAMDTFEMYLADKRSVQMKRQLSFGVLQVIHDLCSSYEEAKGAHIIDMSRILLANEMKNLYLLYQFLGEIFRG